MKSILALVAVGLGIAFLAPKRAPTVTVGYTEEEAARVREDTYAKIDAALGIARPSDSSFDVVAPVPAPVYEPVVPPSYVPEPAPEPTSAYIGSHKYQIGDVLVKDGQPDYRYTVSGIQSVFGPFGRPAYFMNRSGPIAGWDWFDVAGLDSLSSWHKVGSYE